MYNKLKYNKKHQLFYIKINDWVFFRLHKNYKISTIVRFDKKIFQQYISFFQITKKINRLTYWLTISNIWRIHSIFTIIQLKSILSFNSDFFNRLRFIESNFVVVKSDIDKVKLYKIKRLFNKQQTARCEIKYLMK